MTKKEKELQSLRHRIDRLEKLRDQAIRDLVMAESRLPALRKQALRLRDRLLVRELRAQQLPHGRNLDVTLAKVLDEAAAGPAECEAKDGSRVDDTAPIQNQTGTEPITGHSDEHDDGLDLPAALDRTRRLQTLPDPRTPEKRAERRTIEKEKRDRELRGKTRRMPPSGKDALAAIRDAR